MTEISTKEMMTDLRDNEKEIKAWEMIWEGFAILVKHPKNRRYGIRLMQAEERIEESKGLSMVIKRALVARGIK